MWKKKLGLEKLEIELSKNPALAREIAKGEVAQEVTEEQREMAYESFTNAQRQHDDSQVSFEGFGDLGSFASTLDEEVNDPSIKEEFEIAATGHPTQEQQPAQEQSPATIPTNQIS